MSNIAKLQNLKGGITHNEGIKLHSLASLAEHTIVEIGSYCGKSTCYLATGATGSAKVYAIDLWDMRLLPKKVKLKKYVNTGSVHDVCVIAEYKFPKDKSGNIADRIVHETWKTFLKQVKNSGCEDTIITIKGCSQEIAKVWSKPIDLLFIDGDHRYENCLADYYNYAKYIVRGGYLAIHDYKAQYNYDVTKVVDTVIKPSELWGDWEITDTLITCRRK